MAPTNALASLPLPSYVKEFYAQFTHLTPIQQKAVSAGLLQGSSLLVCAPTASGKTLIATMAIATALAQGGKALYIVPLKALASEKHKEYQQLLEHSPYKVILSTGEVDSESDYLAKYDVLILTTEKLDSLLRHRVSWLGTVKVVVMDEIHLLNDPGRGPTVEIILTLLKMLLQPQLIALSATIGNPQELASWLEAALVQDTWRPIELKQGIREGGKVEFYGSSK
ncbi:DEAD/DEAH box helicase [Candidatus Woesearchaeota archaeon]|nr:DEAD/DEAH box helicase [Candidatus Woesearchaeota archaeon]